MERRVAERIAAKAARKSGQRDIPPWKQSGSIDAYTDSEERAPDSGVRASEPGLRAASDAEARPLTFTVYSVEELDARQRFSAPPASEPPPPPSRWPDVWRSTKALMRAWWGWYKTPKPRSRMMDVCGVPIATLRVDLFAALQQLPWKKILVRGGIGFASVFFLLFLVLTAAELTDDLKPGAPRSSSHVETTNALVAPKPVASVEAAPSAEPPAIELDDAPPAPKKAAVPVKKAPPPKKRKKGADVFNP